MRSDMSKVVVERPRYQGWKGPAKAPPVYEEDWEDNVPAKQGMRKPYSRGRKQFSDFLNPLEGFFRSKVGENWDDVYSELREHISTNKTMDMHIMQHVRGMVDLDVEKIDGVIYSKIGANPLTSYRGDDFYVDPDTKRLCLTPKRAKYQKREPITLIWFKDNPYLQYRLMPSYKWVRGQKVVNSYHWYALFLGKKPEPVLRTIPVYGPNSREVVSYQQVWRQEYKDEFLAIQPSYMDSYRRTPLTSRELYGDENLYCCGMKQLNTKELDIVRATLQ